jgi:putative ABC transport system permease protein
MVISAHPDNQGFAKYLFINLMPGDIERTIKTIEKAIKKISPEFPFEYSFTNAELEGYINEIKQINSTFRFASVISILLAIIGLVALTYQATQSRIKEIGIRKVNGAQTIEVVALLNNSFMWDIIIAYLIACPVAWMVIIRLLQGIDNKTTITWWLFLLAGFMVGLVVLMTVSLQSWRAATRNPIEALRYE